MTGVALIQEIERLKAEGYGWRNICVMLDLKTPGQQKFVRDLVIKQPARKVA